ncbi:MAG TPA: hypothetical protein VK961_11355 [Chthoniobacter sp.]|nr:hypothetical protein [Chthoniobacter sp.]
MYTYEDLSDLARAKEERRERLVSRIRGWLRKERSPRLTIGLLLLPTAVFGMGADWALRRGGLDLEPLRWMLALFATWPIFVLLLRWRAAMEWRHLHLDRLGLEYIRYDDGAEAALTAPRQVKLESEMRRAIQDSISREAGKAAGAALPVVLLLGALTLGCWTIWQLIRSGPNLLTNVIIDGEAVPSSGVLATRVQRENWFSATLGETYLFFLSLAFAAFVLGLTLSYFLSFREYKRTHPPHSAAFLHFVVSNRPFTV